MRGSRAWILWTSALLGLIAVAWMGAVVYVDVQAGRDVADLKRKFPKDPEKWPTDRPWPLDYQYAILRIHARACPALPRLIDALDPADHPYFTASLSTIISIQVSQTHGDQHVGPDRMALMARMSALRIDAMESPAERERKIHEWRRWWKEEGSTRHPAWRFWTSGCVNPIVDPETRDPY